MSSISTSSCRTLRDCAAPPRAGAHSAPSLIMVLTGCPCPQSPPPAAIRSATAGPPPRAGARSAQPLSKILRACRLSGGSTRLSRSRRQPRAAACRAGAVPGAAVLPMQRSTSSCHQRGVRAPGLHGTSNTPPVPLLVSRSRLMAHACHPLRMPPARPATCGTCGQASAPRNAPQGNFCPAS
jgi:hypothetical protein